MNRGRWPRQLWIFLAVLAWTALGAWLAGLTGAEATAYVAVAMAIVAATAQSLFNRHTTARYWLMGSCAATLVLVVCASFLEPGLVLAAEGRQVTAVVTYVDVATGGHGQRYYSYSLRHLDGTPITGQLDPPYYDNYAVGQHVQVLEDPTGTVGPNLPGNLDITGYSIATGAGLAGLLLCLIMIGRAAEGEDPFWSSFPRVFGIGRRSS